MINTVSISVVLIGITLIFILSNDSISSSAFQNSAIPDFLTYVNSTYGIKMQVPSDWDLQEVGSASNDSTITIIRLALSFDIHRSFDTDPSDGSTYIDINEQKDFRNISLDSLMKNNINFIKNDKNTSDFKPMSSTTDAILAVQKAYTLVYASKYNGLKTITMDSVTLYGDRIYSATISAEPLNYVEFVQTAQKMVGSLKLTMTS